MKFSKKFDDAVTALIETHAVEIARIEREQWESAAFAGDLCVRCRRPEFCHPDGSCHLYVRDDRSTLLREVNQILVEEIGADAPDSAKAAAERAVKLIRSLRSTVTELESEVRVLENEVEG